MQVVQTYEDSWALSGFQVREDHGLDTAIIYENQTQGDPVNSENLWQAAYGLATAFISGRDEDGDAQCQRDEKEVIDGNNSVLPPSDH
jgi:hypothetical protein